MLKSIRIIQLSDMHLCANKKETFLNMNPYNSFMAVIDLLQKIIKKKPVSLIVLTGDISQDASSESYHHCLSNLKEIDCPIAWIPGNHDSLDVCESVFYNSYFSQHKHFVFSSWDICLLNSLQKNHVAGWLEEEQLLFLDNSLQQSKGFGLVMLHHHVLPVQTKWIDKNNLKNNDEFLRIAAKFSNLKAVVCGHVHLDSHQFYQKIHYYSTPSTSIQFKPLAENFTLDPQMPGLRILDLYDNGEIITTVERIAYAQQFIPDLNSKGY